MIKFTASGNSKYILVDEHIDFITHRWLILFLQKQLTWYEDNVRLGL